MDARELSSVESHFVARGKIAEGVGRRIWKSPMLVIDDIHELFEKCDGRSDVEQATLEFAPIAAAEIFAHIQPTVVHEGEVLCEGANDVSRFVRSIIDHQIVMVGDRADRRHTGLAAGVRHDYGYPRLFECELCALWIDIASDYPRRPRKVAAPQFERAAVLYPDFEQADGAVAEGREKALVLQEVARPLMRQLTGVLGVQLPQRLRAIRIHSTSHELRQPRRAIPIYRNRSMDCIERVAELVLRALLLRILPPVSARARSRPTRSRPRATREPWAANPPPACISSLRRSPAR